MGLGWRVSKNNSIRALMGENMQEGGIILIKIKFLWKIAI
jgi:hypothetical protein